MQKNWKQLKKNIGQKVSVKIFNQKIEKIGLVGEKILGHKIGVKNSRRKTDEKNWSSY